MPRAKHAKHDFEQRHTTTSTPRKMTQPSRRNCLMTSKQLNVAPAHPLTGWPRIRLGRLVSWPGTCQRAAVYSNSTRIITRWQIGNVGPDSRLCFARLLVAGEIDAKMDNCAARSIAG